MANVYSEIKSIYDKHFKDIPLVWECKTNFRSMDTSDPEIKELARLEEILESNGQTNPYLNTLYVQMKKALSEEGDEATSDVVSDEEDPELGKNEETFQSKYPNVDAKETLKRVYVEWIDAMSNKPFYKTIAAFYDMAKMNQLNFVDRAFLWKFLKAISSCITHLLIEGEQKEESICLVDMYFDSLNECLLNSIHAKSKDDVIQSFLYMVSFLGLNRDVHSDGEASTPSASASTDNGAGGSVGEF